jgi:hypothetical protein
MNFHTRSPLQRLQPAFAADRWVNTVPIDPDTLDGKIVLIDIWEFTCINWIRTRPYVQAWHRDYSALGLVVIGAHAPEFEFGRLADNIDRGIEYHQLTYPIAIDNEYAIWDALSNNAWPAKYLFDRRGKRAHQWTGEGDYDEIDAAIRHLLTEAQPGISLPPVSAEVAAFAAVGNPNYAGITPETYIGSSRGQPGVVTLHGTWRSALQYVELESATGEIAMPFAAAEVNLVVQPGRSGRSAVSVLVDGEPVGPARGADVGPDSIAQVDRSGMFRLVSGASDDLHLLTLVVDDPGLRAYVLTFGP